ncbi:MAG: TraX family protein [Bacillota bacterium]|jgi:hypothetical protein|nr:TraX family protein [Bacillota bacterium]
MAGAKGREIRLSTDTALLKVIAMLSMVIDHVGKMFFPGMPWMRLAGRLAFPLFAYCIAAGCVYTKNPLRYALRVLVLALVSQPIYVLALGHVSGAMQAAVAGGLTVRGGLYWYVSSLETANILFTLLPGILIIWSLQEKRYIATGLVALAVWYFSPSINYGWRGVALILLFWALIDRPLPSLFWTGGFMAWWAITGGTGYHIGPIGFGIQGYALLALPLIYLPVKTGIKIPKWFFYAFYPLHLLVIYLVLQLG